MQKGPLSDRALILNRSWLAISTASVRDALVLLYRGSAHAMRPGTYELFGFDSWRALEHDPDEPHVVTTSAPLRVPEVIVLVRYDGVPSRARACSRRGVLQRDRWTCQYCGARPGAVGLTIDHVVPRSRGGATAWENCVAACAACNARKRDRTPEEAGLTLLRRPERPPRVRALDPQDEVRASWMPFLGELIG